MNFESNSYAKFVKGINNIEKVNPTYDQFIIKPPERNKTHGRIGIKLVVDSRDRDLTLYPESNDYVYKCPEEYKDVISAELVLGDFPNSGYNVYSKNNEMIIESGAISQKILVPFGEYTNSNLIDILNGSNGDLFKTFTSADIYFNFSVNPNNNRIKIQSNRKFTFNLDYTLNNRYQKKYTASGFQRYNCDQGDINNYYDSIKYYSIDKTLGFDRKMHTAENKYLPMNYNCIDNQNNFILEDITATSTGASVGTSDNGYVMYDITLTSDEDAREIYSVGDYIEFQTGQIYRIVNIINKNTIKVEDFKSIGAPPFSITILPYYAIYAESVFDIECPQYVILDIPEFHYLKSKETSINESFAIIPFRPGCKTTIDSAHVSLDKEIKYFNPPLARLTSLRIKFLRYDGTLYDFMGRNHVFALKITTLNQPGKYNNFNPSFFSDE